MYDIIVIGAGAAGASFAFKMAKYAKVLLVETNKENYFPKGTKVFPQHNHPFINEIEWENREIYPRIHKIIRYLGTEEEGIVNSEEFGEPFGNICYIENLLKELVKEYVNFGGIIKFNEKIHKIIKHNDYVEIINNKGESYQAKLLALATGSHSLELQKSIGFDIPDTYTGIYSHMYGDEDKVNENLPIEYNFHINSKISRSGPFFMCKGQSTMGEDSRIFSGFLGSQHETEQEIYSKYESILKNYKKIQPYIHGLKQEKPTLTKISKHSIKSFSQDRIIVLGEAAGLTTSFFYEGLVATLASAEISAQTIIPLVEKNSDFNRTELKKIDDDLKRIVLNTYFKNNKASEYLFYNTNPSNINKLFNTYAKLVNSNRKIREYIWEAHVTHQLENYDVKGEFSRYFGEELYKKLSFTSKILLGPLFLKALFK